MNKIIMSFFTVVTIAFSASAASALDAATAKNIYETKIKSWLNNPVVIEAVKAQNAKHASLTQADIEELDDKWKSRDTTIIAPVADCELSEYLKNVVAEGEGLYTEIFVMDNKGLNVGMSEKTSDFWQGDEAKFQETYPKGTGVLNIGEVEFDESSQLFQFQLSVTVAEGKTPIGAVTVGLNADKAK